MLRVEVCVTDIEGVRVACDAGADRVELCSALDLGGLTPSLALVERAVAVAGATEVHVLLRGRPGDFVADADDVALAIRDAELALEAGAAGVVAGPLRADGRFDLEAMRALRDVAGARCLTAHRAVDVHPDVEGTIADLVDVGVDRVLTSGGAASAHDGAARIARAVAAAQGRLAVMAGGGIVPERVDGLVAATGIADVHLSARRLVAEDAGFGARHATDPRVLARIARR